MKYKLSDDEIQEVIRTVTGGNKKDITWDQFNTYLTSKVEKKNLNAWILEVFLCLNQEKNFE